MDLTFPDNPQRRAYRRNGAVSRVDVVPDVFPRAVDDFASGELVDVGCGGVRARVGRWIDQGTRCRVRIPDPDGRVEPDETFGVVRWARREAGRVLLGIEFDAPLNALYVRSMEAKAGELPALRVLVVDDDPDLRELMGRLLTRYGCEVETLSDGDRALEALRQRMPDMVLLDMRMPGVDGLEVLRRMRQESLPAVPVWAMSGYVSDTEAEEAMRLGAIGFISKPLDFKHLRRVMRLSGIL